MAARGDGWMTYAELGAARGISTASATRLAFRRKWSRQVGNDGIARVSVPVSEARAQPDKADASPHDARDDVMGDISHLASSFVVEIAAMRERAERAEQLLRDAEAAFAAEREQARVAVKQARREAQEAAEAAVAWLEQARREAQEATEAANAAAEQARVAVGQAQREAQEAAQAVEAWRRADEARKAKGPLARLRAAWRGE
jgi:hypothetical protein